MEYDHINLENMDKLRTALPDCEFKDIGKPTMCLRMVKSDEEIAHIRQGAQVCDIALELNKVYESHGLLQNRTFGYGHSFGVLCHYYGRETGLELREDVETILQPNMVVSMKPMIMIPEGSPVLAVIVNTIFW